MSIPQNTARRQCWDYPRPQHQQFPLHHHQVLLRRYSNDSPAYSRVRQVRHPKQSPRWLRRPLAVKEPQRNRTDSRRRNSPSSRIKARKICIGIKTFRPNRCAHRVRPARKFQKQRTDCLWFKIWAKMWRPKTKPNQIHRNPTSPPKNKLTNVDLYSFLRKRKVPFWILLCISTFLSSLFNLIIREIHRQRRSVTNWKLSRSQTERERERETIIYAEHCDQQLPGESAFPARLLIAIKETSTREFALISSTIPIMQFDVVRHVLHKLVRDWSTVVSTSESLSFSSSKCTRQRCMWREANWKQTWQISLNDSWSEIKSKSS